MCFDPKIYICIGIARDHFHTFENVSFVVGTGEHGVDFAVASAQFRVASAAVVERHSRCRRPARQKGSGTGFGGCRHTLALPVQLLNNFKTEIKK